MSESIEKVKCLIVGSGPEEKNVRDMANLKANVHYMGLQSKQDTISIY